MNKSLIIVESPTKAKTISKFLGSHYQVEASFGHVRDLPKSKLSIDVKKDFEPTYAIPTKAKEVIDKLKKLAKDADEIILATDADREGESISWHLVQALGLATEKQIASGKLDDNIKRIVFHEITESAIKHALEHPGKLNIDLVNAQQARRVLDRLVGYELSPFLWRKIRYGLSAGRVQSVALRLIVEREREIQKFKSDEYWTIEALFNKPKDPQKFPGKLYSIEGKTLDKLAIKSDKEAGEITSDLEESKYSVKDVTQKEVTRNPAPPFTTSTLQQEAARKLGLSAKQTMMIAQQLYEQGHITYMRTDSLNLAESSLSQAHSVINERFGNNYSLSQPRRFHTKSKGAQEAHEAIRPTDLSLDAQQVKGLVPQQRKLYALIWKRTLACQMQPANMLQTSVDIETVGVTKKLYGFKATGQVIKFDGFLRVYTEGNDDSETDATDTNKLPELTNGQELEVTDLQGKQHFTEPPPRYTDATLVKALETNGVGRPSTYAPTLQTIQDRDYVEKTDKKYFPTEVGILVTDLLVEHFPEIVDVGFTSKIEEEFDEVAEGKIKWPIMIKEFYDPFKKHLAEKEATVEKQVEVSDTPCPHCGKMMLIKYGRMGKFLACPDPESKVTLPMPEEAAMIKQLSEKTKDERCPICGKPMEVKRGRFGYFLGCSDYPNCKGISKIWNKTGFKCPHCPEINITPPGDIVEKKGRGRSKPFWACTKYPDCNLVFNKKPESQEELDELYKTWKEIKDKPAHASPKTAKKKTKK